MSMIFCSNNLMFLKFVEDVILKTVKINSIGFENVVCFYKRLLVIIFGKMIELSTIYSESF